MLNQLALVTKMRLLVAEGQHEQRGSADLASIIKNTNLLAMVHAILQAPDNVHPELVRYLKLEATWILTNVTFCDEDIINEMLDQQYDFVTHFNLILEGKDYQMIDQVIWLIANIAATSDNLKNQMLSQTYVVKQMYNQLNMNSAIKKGYIKTIVWCCCNFVQPDENGKGPALAPDEFL